MDKAPAKRIQHFIQHHTTLILCEMLHSFDYLVVSCCIVLYRVVSCCINGDQTFSLNKCCTILHFFCFPGCCNGIVWCMMSFCQPMQLSCNLLYSRTCTCITCYEMLYWFGTGLKKLWTRQPFKEQTTSVSCVVLVDLLRHVNKGLLKQWITLSHTGKFSFTEYPCQL